MKKENIEYDRRGERAGILGILVNLVLAGGKFVLGWMSGSISVLADAANNLSDCGSAALTILGFRLSARPADKEHPFGHARYEYISGLIIALLILLLGFSFLKESVGRIFGGAASEFGALTLILLGVSIVAKLTLGLYNRHMAALLSSQTLRAASIDSFSDAVLTSVVLLCGLLRAATGIDADGWVGVAVALLILIEGVKLVREATELLLGKAVDPETVEQLEELIHKSPEVLGMHDLMLHSYGEGRIFATAHIEIDSRKTLIDAHEIANRVEESVEREMSISLVVHVDPMINDDHVLAELRKSVADLLRGISPRLGYHDLRLHEEGGQRVLSLDLTVPCDFVLPDSELIGLVGREISELDPTLVSHLHIDRDFGK